MWQPLVSVIIPVYNGSDYLKEAIDSVLNQTYSNIELIVVNDGSSDGNRTEQIALSYGDRIHYMCKENGGVATALNTGIKQMRGEYFLWLSHDDVFYQDKVEKQVQLALNRNVRMTACAYDIFYNSGRKIPVPFVDFYGYGTIQNSVFSVLHGLIQFGGVLLRRDIFDDYGFFRTELKASQDYEFLFRVLRKENCIYSNEILYGIRYHSNQGSNTMSCVNMERDNEHLMFMQELSREEKTRMYRSVYNFYYQMLLRLWPLPGVDKAMDFCLEQLRHEEKLDELECMSFNPLPVLIYGAGMYGQRFLFDLRCRGIKVAGFLDSNEKIWGSTIDGTMCYSLQDVKDGRVSGTIVIASVFREEIAATLKEKGISEFYFKEQWDKETLKTAPVWKKIEETIDSYRIRNGNEKE